MGRVTVEQICYNGCFACSGCVAIKNNTHNVELKLLSYKTQEGSLLSDLIGHHAFS